MEYFDLLPGQRLMCSVELDKGRHVCLEKIIKILEDIVTYG